MKRATPALLLLAPLALAACGSLGKISEIGRPPAMTPPEDPTKSPTYRPMTMPMPTPQTTTPEANSLWRMGSRAFFKDQRAAQVGDLVTVLINMTDSANLSNNTTAGHNGSETMGMPNLFGLETLLPRVLGKAVSASSLVSTTSADTNAATAQIQRTETVTLRLAGVVTQVLPNGNLVVSAHQEMRVGDELRDLEVSGVIRPQDIASDNTVLHDRMAEARISYGGRGTMTDVQTPRWGQQVLDAVLPF